jgi:hypothetical protein
MRGDDHKRCRDAPYILARLLYSFTRTREQRPWGTTVAARELGFRFRRRSKKARAVARVGNSRVTRGLISLGVVSLVCGPREPAHAGVGLGGGARHGRVRRGNGSMKGMIGGPQRRRRSGGLVVANGPKGQAGRSDGSCYAGCSAGKSGLQPAAARAGPAVWAAALSCCLAR